MVSDVRVRFRALFQRRAMESELQEEIRFHLERQTEKYVGSGLTREEAARRARVEFGGSDQIKEECRDERGVRWIESLLQDVGFAVRMLRKSPGFAAVAVLTLALGIGASTAVFSIVGADLLKPPPFPHVERVVFPWRHSASEKAVGDWATEVMPHRAPFPWGRRDFQFIAHETRTFEALGAFQGGSFNLTGAGDVARLDGLRVSAGFFPSLGVIPALGRIFTEEEDHPGREAEVILSDQLWRERFGSDRRILGRRLQLNGILYTVIGVMPGGFMFPRANEMPSVVFTFPPRVQLWVPLALPRATADLNETWDLAVVGRLKPGVAVGRAQAEMNLLGRRLDGLFPNQKGWFAFRVTSLARQAGGENRRPLLLMLGAVGVVLLIACSNVASLLLSRFLGRKRELNLRAALGGRRSRIIRQLVTESVVLTGVGGLFGVLVAECIVSGARILGPSSIPGIGRATVDIRTFSVIVGTALLIGVLCGVIPALGGPKGNLLDSPGSGRRRAGSSLGVQRIRNILCVSQVALAVVLVVSAGILTRTLSHLLAVDTGIRSTSAVTFELSLPSARYFDQAHVAAFYQRALQRLRALPGVQSAGLAESVPLSGTTDTAVIRIPDQRLPKGVSDHIVYSTTVSPGYFASVGTPIVNGRDFLESDGDDSTPLAVISSALAARLWPDQNPIGRRLTLANLTFPPVKVVGVSADVRRMSLRDPPATEMYVPYMQKMWPSQLSMDVVLRTAGNPSLIAADAHAAIRSIDPDVPVSNIRPLADIVATSIAGARFSTELIEGFGALAFVLAAIGMYGLVSYGVAERTREIAIRIALGARQGNVFGLVVRQSARVAFGGILIGVAVAIAVTRLVKGFVYGVPPADPVTFAGALLLFLGVALLACYIPARRALRTDPFAALRYE
ncbi:MAG: ADOP family duplicated permease [Thermoanaerobaculia bacterium]